MGATTGARSAGPRASLRSPSAPTCTAPPFHPALSVGLARRTARKEDGQDPFITNITTLKTGSSSARDLHILKLFMNLLRHSKLASPLVSELEHNEVPEWRSGAGDWSRVLARAFEDQSPRAAALAGDRRSVTDVPKAGSWPGC